MYSPQKISDGFRTERNSHFEAFVDYLLSAGTERNNLHFRPYWSRCTTCSLHLDFIGKSESMVKDRLYLKNRLGLKVKTLNVLAKVHIGPDTKSSASGYTGP